MIANRLIPNLRSFSSSSAPRILHIGDVLTSSKQFSDQDVLQFSNLTLDFNPLHFDPHIARQSGFRDRIVHGILVASLFPRTIAFHFAGAVYVSQSLQFKSPVYVGERVVAEVRPVQLRQNKDKYIAKFATKCFKDREVVVIDGEAVALLPNLEIIDGK
ncbi:hypothetical protein Scep_001375 [Stephania cephalantha]|uniref:MaoC-like domain-containing protein n=1 Tax=Stephania cephalantha TaxID=152367 RepID=A0AAP0LBV9_9MAGN